MKDYIYNLNTRFTLPDYRALNNHILNKYYDTIHIKMNLQLKASRWLNFYTNKSNNIRRKRIINLLTHVSLEYDIDERYFYINSKINDSKTINIDTQLTYVLRQIIIMIDKNLEKMNSLIIDTCATMRFF